LTNGLVPFSGPSRTHDLHPYDARGYDGSGFDNHNLPTLSTEHCTNDSTIHRDGNSQDTQTMYYPYDDTYATQSGTNYNTQYSSPPSCSNSNHFPSHPPASCTYDHFSSSADYFPCSPLPLPSSADTSTVTPSTFHDLSSLAITDNPFDVSPTTLTMTTQPNGSTGYVRKKEKLSPVLHSSNLQHHKPLNHNYPDASSSHLNLRSSSNSNSNSLPSAHAMSYDVNSLSGVEHSDCSGCDSTLSQRRFGT